MTLYIQIGEIKVLSGWNIIEYFYNMWCVWRKFIRIRSTRNRFLLAMCLRWTNQTDLFRYLGFSQTIQNGNSPYHAPMWNCCCSGSTAKTNVKEDPSTEVTFEFFRIEFYRIYRTVVLKMKITKNSFLHILQILYIL